MVRVTLNDYESGYGRARPGAPSSARRIDPLTARRRIVAGAILGVLAQMILATVLGLVGVSGGGLGATIAISAFSSLIATPACLILAFALMLGRNTRQLGTGILLGAVVGTLLLMGGCAAFG